MTSPVLGLLVTATVMSQAIGQVLWASARVAAAALVGTRRRPRVAAVGLRVVLAVSVAGVALAPMSAAAKSNDVAYLACERAASKIHGRAARELARRACARITLATTTTTVGAKPTGQEPLRQLDDLHIGDEVLDGYVRNDWPHWSDADGDGCNTRKEVLKARSTTPAVIEAGSVCTIVAGTWVDPYGGRTLTSPSQVEIDHLVPLANAYRSGGHTWTVTQREAFANDPVELVVTTSAANTAKADKRPDQWLPPRPEARCWYATTWIAIKTRYELSVTPSEHDALAAAITRYC